MTGSRTALTLVAHCGPAWWAGVFFAFSAFVMKALARLPSAEGIVAMQSINTGAPAPLFMGTLFGTALASVALAIVSLPRLDQTAAGLQLSGSGLYLGAVLVTVVRHVPLTTRWRPWLRAEQMPTATRSATSPTGGVEPRPHRLVGGGHGHAGCGASGVAALPSETCGAHRG